MAEDLTKEKPYLTECKHCVMWVGFIVAILTESTSKSA
jgi:hypothetical protein